MVLAGVPLAGVETGVVVTINVALFGALPAPATGAAMLALVVWVLALA